MKIIRNNNRPTFRRFALSSYYCYYHYVSTTTMMMMMIIIISRNVVVVQAQASAIRCREGEDICGDSFEGSCQQFIVDHHFSGCCSFSDDDNDGCRVTTATPGGSCTIDGRTYHCAFNIDDGTKEFFTECLGGYQHSFSSELGEGEEVGACPPSDYQTRETKSQSETHCKWS